MFGGLGDTFGDLGRKSREAKRRKWRRREDKGKERVTHVMCMSVLGRERGGRGKTKRRQSEKENERRSTGTGSEKERETKGKEKEKGEGTTNGRRRNGNENKKTNF